jgi:hypothetical protein
MTTEFNMGKAQQQEPIWYTATLTIRGKRGTSVEERRATSEEEILEMLKAEGINWMTIKVVKGRNPGIGNANRKEPYSAEMHSMTGNYINLKHWRPSRGKNLTNSAKDGWESFIDKYPHGLSVSDFPRYLDCGEVINMTLRLVPEHIRDPNRWDDITLMVHEQLDYWKDRLHEALFRHNALESRWGVNARRHRVFEERLKELEVFDEWSYQRLLQNILPGKIPNPLDLDNIRLYDLHTGEAIRVTFCGHDHLRMEFWCRLLSLWDGPIDQREEVVREFLDYHQLNGGKPEIFRDLVKGTIPLLHGMRTKETTQKGNVLCHFPLHDTERWELLANKLAGWL